MRSPKQLALFWRRLELQSSPTKIRRVCGEALIRKPHAQLASDFHHAFRSTQFLNPDLAEWRSIHETHFISIVKQMVALLDHHRERQSEDGCLLLAMAVAASGPASLSVLTDVDLSLWPKRTDDLWNGRYRCVAVKCGAWLGGAMGEVLGNLGWLQVDGLPESVRLAAVEPLLVIAEGVSCISEVLRLASLQVQAGALRALTMAVLTQTDEVTLQRELPGTVRRRMVMVGTRLAAAPFDCLPNHREAFVSRCHSDWIRSQHAALEYLHFACRLFPYRHEQQAVILAVAVSVLHLAEAFTEEELDVCQSSLAMCQDTVLLELADTHKICLEVLKMDGKAKEGHVDTSNSLDLKVEVPEMPVFDDTAWTSFINNGYAVVDGFLDENASLLLARAGADMLADGELLSPGQPNRDDVLIFLDPDGPEVLRDNARSRADAGVDGGSWGGLCQAINKLQLLLVDLRARLYLHSTGMEYQLAVYSAPCIGFHKHRDELPIGMVGAHEDVESLPRRVTAICYGSSSLPISNGGCLHLHLPGTQREGPTTVQVVPHAGRLVVFLSGSVYHEVAKVAPGVADGAKRVALTAWFR